MELRDVYDEGRRTKMAEAHRRDMEKRRRRGGGGGSKNDDTTKVKGGGGGKDDVDENENDDDDSDDDDDGDNPTVDVDGDGTSSSSFVPPKHMYGTKLAVYHANRAACLLHLGRYGECIDDCTMAILFDPMYVKPYSRRSTAYERIASMPSPLIPLASNTGTPSDTS